MAFRSQTPWTPFALTASDLKGFLPTMDGWSVRSLPIHPDPIEPNILVLDLQGKEHPADRTVLRLVHGYNMHDCMRIKGYQVDLLSDTRQPGLPNGPSSASPEPDHGAPARSGPVLRTQTWRVTSSSGEAAIWVTGLIEAGDFKQTGVDIRSMAFPRVGTVDSPDWMPRGVSLSDLRHPVSYFKMFLQAKWNNSRCDWPTFLRLRQPSWASEELLTVVATWRGGSVEPAREAEVTDRVMSSYRAFYAELRRWRTRPQ